MKKALIGGIYAYTENVVVHRRISFSAMRKSVTLFIVRPSNMYVYVAAPFK